MTLHREPEYLPLGGSGYTCPVCEASPPEPCKEDCAHRFRRDLGMYGQHVMCRRDRAGTFYGEIDGLKAVFGAPDLETCNKWAFDLIRATNKAFGLTRDGTLPPPGAIGERHTMAGRARRAEQERRKKEKG